MENSGQQQRNYSGAGQSSAPAVRSAAPSADARSSKAPFEAAATANEPLSGRTVAQESLETSHRVLSLADQEKRSAHPAALVFWTVAVLLAATVPYWFGRQLAIMRTQQAVAILTRLSMQGLALIAWIVVTAVFLAVDVAIIAATKLRRRIAGGIAYILFAIEQFLAGIGLLKLNFWYSTYAVYGRFCGYANAVNIGIVSSAIGFFVFAICFVIMMLLAKRGSKLSGLLQGTSAFTAFMLVEFASVSIVLFSGLLPSMAG